MKSAESKTTTASQLSQTAKSSPPFFSKAGEGSLFSKEAPQTDFFFNPATVQCKLTIGAPNDPYEQEADTMAEKVVQRLSVTGGRQTVGAPSVQRKCAACEGEEKLQKMEGEEEEEIPQLQRKAIFEGNEEQSPIGTFQGKTDTGASEASSDLENRLSASRGGGQALPDDTRSSMESAFGADFNNVRVHTGGEAVQMNKELGAQAFTHGRDIYFNAGKYDTGSTEGQRLLGHELTHVVQQGAGRVRASAQAAAMPANEGTAPEADKMIGEALPSHLQKKEHGTGCNCPACAGQSSPNEASNSIWRKGHEAGCPCDECTGAGSTQTGNLSLLTQRKQTAVPAIQLKPENVVSHTFLGIGVGGGVDKKLRDRLKLVEAELKKQYDALPAAGKPATLKAYAGVNSIGGYQGRKGNHGAGKAVDVNYWNQPYIATRTTEVGKTTFGGEEGNATPATQALRRPAVEVYDRAVSFTNFQGLSADVGNRKEGESATETYRRFKLTSDALAKYFSLAFHTNSDEVERAPILNPETATEADLLLIPTTERLDEATAIANITSFMDGFWWKILHPGYLLTPREQYFRILRDYEIVRKPMQRGKPAAQPDNTRNPSLGFLHLPEHFVVAMMDVGKLRWGACEFSAGSNGDVHHFDLTNPHHTPALTSGLSSAPAKVLWKVDKSSSPPNVEELNEDSWEHFMAHHSGILATGLYEMYAHPVVVSGDTYLKVYKKDGSFQFWPTNEYNLIEMPDDLGQKGGKNVLGGHITNYSPDDVEATEGDRFLSPAAAAALINTMGRFHLSSRNAQLQMGDASTRTGDSPRIEAGKSKRHATHYKGNAFDARYLNAQGQSDRIDAGIFDTKANYDFIKTAIDEGFRFVVIGTNKVFNDLKTKLSALTSYYKGLKVIRESHHNDHMHLALKESVAAGKSSKVTKSRDMESEWLPILELIGIDPEDVFVPSDSRLNGEDIVSPVGPGIQARLEKTPVTGMEHFRSIKIEGQGETQQAQGAPPLIQRRTVPEHFATPSSERGPIWDVNLTITQAPETNTESFEDFESAVHDGIMSAARALGNSTAQPRRMTVRIRYRRIRPDSTDHSDISQEAYRLALQSVQGVQPQQQVQTQPQPQVSSQQTQSPPALAVVPCTNLPLTIGGGMGNCGAGDDAKSADFPPITDVPWSVMAQALALDTQYDHQLATAPLALLTTFAGMDGILAWNQFYGAGGPSLSFPTGSDVSDRTKRHSAFTAALTSVKAQLISNLTTQAAGHSINCPSISLSTIPSINLSGTSDMKLYALIGGTQGLVIELTRIEILPLTKVVIADIKFKICDDFGVDISDLSRSGVRGQAMNNVLLPFWILQHRRTGHTPFVLTVEVEETITENF